MFARRAVSLLSRSSIQRRFTKAENKEVRLQAYDFINNPTTIGFVLAGAVALSYIASWGISREITGTGLTGWSSPEDNGLMAAYTADTYQSGQPAYFGSDSEFGSSYKTNN